MNAAQRSMQPADLLLDLLAAEVLRALVSPAAASSLAHTRSHVQESPLHSTSRWQTAAAAQRPLSMAPTTEGWSRKHPQQKHVVPCTVCGLEWNAQASPANRQRPSISGAARSCRAVAGAPACTLAAQRMQVRLNGGRRQGGCTVTAPDKRIRSPAHAHHADHVPL